MKDEGTYNVCLFYPKFHCELSPIERVWCRSKKHTRAYANGSTSVMIYHRRASLSKQHTDLLICHCTKQDLSHTSTCRYVEKSSPEIAR